MDITSLGSGVGSGFLASLLTFWGFKSRLDRMDMKMDSAEKRMGDIEQLYMPCSACVRLRDGCGVRLTTMEQTQNRMEQVQTQMAQDIGTLIGEIKGIRVSIKA